MGFILAGIKVRLMWGMENGHEDELRAPTIFSSGRAG
jgi:hypothetical protein